MASSPEAKMASVLHPKWISDTVDSAVSRCSKFN